MEDTKSLEDLLKKVLPTLRNRFEIDLHNYLLPPLLGRLEIRLKQLNISLHKEYLDKFNQDPGEPEKLLDVFAIKVTSFFRDPLIFELIGGHILPQIFESKRKLTHKDIRVWSAACATGEEVYSLSILMNEAIKDRDEKWQKYIFGTDINQKAIIKAQKGVYPAKSLEDTKLNIINKYFGILGKNYQLKDSIINSVIFSNEDLTSADKFTPASSIFGSFDLILCRNVLIYFTQYLQNRVLRNLHNSLNPGGFLILGESETINDYQSRFNRPYLMNQIYQKKQLPE